MRTRTRHRGGMLIYSTIAMVALTGVCSLAVDWGRVQLAKTELYRAADAAARAAAAQVPNGAAAAQAAAITVAAYNPVDGQPLALQSSDISVGKWDAATQTLDTTSLTPDAVQIVARRDATRGNPIPLVWGRLIGPSSANLKATVTATNATKFPNGFVGLNSISTHANLFAASYSSAVTTSPSHTSYRSNTLLRSNGPITDTSTGNKVYGGVDLGPSASIDGSITVSGSTNSLAQAITAPAAVTMTPMTNPGGVGAIQLIGNNTTLTWPGGTYYFTFFLGGDNITINFTGPATVYMDGFFWVHDHVTINAYNDLPANLQFYQSAGKTFFANDYFTFTGQMLSPGADLLLHDNAVYCGTLYVKSITVNDNNDFYLDETLASTTSGTVISTVQ